MSDIVIKAENIGKLYKLGEIGTGTISHDINRWWARMRGKDDPFAKIGQINDRTKKGESDYVWALQDINFEVRQGEVLGIIGRNGAGKSTLLKILSKVTTPTTGQIKINGRIASLLEVGTGFHPELTGRENIFLNGAILGMTKSEIQKKFDEIVNFAGVDRYIDTPVKRYSSGMYVRLAFAVAAFLEPEILIVDEVLAVGDAEFQKKCIGRIKDLSNNDGRTVLFVSHDLNAIAQLCSKGLVLHKGNIYFDGSIFDAVTNYQSTNRNSANFLRTKVPMHDLYIKEVVSCSTTGIPKTTFLYSETICFLIKIVVPQNVIVEPDVLVAVLDSRKRTVFSCEYDGIKNELFLEIEPKQLVRGEYSLKIFINLPHITVVDDVFDICPFEVIDNGSPMMKHGAYDYGMVLAKYSWLQK